MKRLLLLFVAVGLMAFTTAAIAPQEALAGTEAGLETGSFDDNYLAEVRMEGIRQSYLAGLRREAIRAGAEMPKTGTDGGTASMWLTMVDASAVNMVTNSVDESAVKSVQIDGMAYNVNGEIGALTMTKNPSTRLARDPLTNKTVDKSTAAIFADASGRVYYFESPSTHKEFMALANAEAVYGLRGLDNTPKPLSIVELAPQMLQKVRDFFANQRLRALNDEK